VDDFQPLHAFGNTISGRPVVNNGNNSSSNSRGKSIAALPKTAVNPTEAFIRTELLWKSRKKAAHSKSWRAHARSARQHY
jgi:hypothetical protein